MIPSPWLVELSKRITCRKRIKSDGKSNPTATEFNIPFSFVSGRFDHGRKPDAVCVLVQERHFGPEQMVGIAGSVTNALFILVHMHTETVWPADKLHEKV